MFDEQCDKKTIKSKEDVFDFLRAVRNSLNESTNNLKIEGRSKSEDKTFNFRVEYGITPSMICTELCSLDISNYSYTDKDDDCQRGGNVWIFGQMFFIDGGNKVFELYIKLKLKRKVVCLSFHPKEFDIKYPYL